MRSARQHSLASKSWACVCPLGRLSRLIGTPPRAREEILRVPGQAWQELASIPRALYPKHSPEASLRKLHLLTERPTYLATNEFISSRKCHHSIIIRYLSNCNRAIWTKSPRQNTLVANLCMFCDHSHKNFLKKLSIYTIWKNYILYTLYLDLCIFL